MNESAKPHDLPPAQPQSTGRVELICGCMFSGKTEELLRRARETDPQKVVLFKHTRDNRYSTTEIVTHRHNHHRAVTVSAAAEILQRVPPQAELVGIDEGHFFDPALAEGCRALARRGCAVLVTALDLDSWGRPFAPVMQLREQADAVLIMRAVCAACGRPADHTQRTTPIVNGVMVGGPEAFEPRCMSCWAPPPEAPVD